MNPLTVSKEEYSLIVEQIKSISAQYSEKMKKAEKLKIQNKPITIEGDLWEPSPWSERWEQDLEYWGCWKDEKIELTCHKKINKRLALITSTAFPPSLYTRTSDFMWGLDELLIK